MAPSDLGSLYALHGRWLREWLRARTRCVHWASDLTQDTFCRLIERGEQPADPRRYLATIARRLLIDDVRRREVESAYFESLSILGAPSDALSPERIAEGVDLLRGVMQILETMPAQARQAFLLRRVDGLGHAEIAEALGISIRTVKRWIAEAYVCCYALAYPD